MKNQRKIYGAFLGLAAVAFVADRMFFEPAGVRAAGPAAEQGPALEVQPGTVPSPVAAEPATPTLAERLQAAAGEPGQESRDAFHAAWRVTDKPSTAEKEPRERSGVEEFTLSHKLTSVSDSRAGAGGLAVINGKPLAEGAKIDGWTLVSVGPTWAAFERGLQYVRIELTPPAKSR